MNTALQIAFSGGYGKLGADDNVVGKGLLSFLYPFFCIKGVVNWVLAWKGNFRYTLVKDS